jgi:antitoxin MazE7
MATALHAKQRHFMALASSDMPSDTATIRVPRKTRDSLAARARNRGISLSALLTELSEQAEREDAYRSEREATLKDLESPEAMAEYRLWEGTLEDGIG